MKASTLTRASRHRERGISLFIVAGSMVALVGLVGLAVDLVALYVARSEAQRAADAAALAGAKTFVTSGYTIGGVSSSLECPTSATSPPTGLAGTVAAIAGEQNPVAGKTLASSAFTATCDFSHKVVSGFSTDPIITVKVTATAPTYFMKIFKVSSATVSATATAEAYVPIATSSVCFSCLKPFFLPNCDPVHTSPINTSCAGTAGYWVDPATGNPEHPTQIIGESWTLHTVSGPSQWYEVALDEVPPGCTGGGTQSKTKFEHNVQQCSTQSYACGNQLCALNGAGFGPNGHSVGCLISYGAQCNSQNVTSIDSISLTPAPWTITAGSGNPNASQSQVISQSNSLVTVPLYQGGTTLPPGGGVATIVGWMQMFINGVHHSGSSDDITVTVLSVSGCGNASGGGSNTCTGLAGGGGASFIPVRLICTPGVGSCPS